MSSSSTQATLVCALKRIVRSDETGARVCVRACETVVVTGIDTWSQSFTDELHATHPHADITITAVDSVGGIKIIVTQKQTMSRMRILAVLCTCFAVGLYMLVLTLGHAFDDNFVTPNPWMLNATTNATAGNDTAPPPHACASSRRLR